MGDTVKLSGLSKDGNADSPIVRAIGVCKFDHECDAPGASRGRNNAKLALD